MNKFVISLIGMLATAAFAPQASALPAFARQTGMECNACHQQHFPVLNTFGRAFKAAGYTMMGAQTQVEGEHLAIPSTLNAAVMIKMRYQRQSNGGHGLRDGVAGPQTGDGMVQFGDEFSLFFGGRVGENIGFLMENNVAASKGPLVAGLRVPIMFDMANSKVSVIPFTTDALGVSYGYELSSAGVMRANRWAELRRDASAIQYATSDGNGSHGAYNGAAAGLAMVVQNDMGYINYTRWMPDALPGGNAGETPSFAAESNYLRIAVTPTVGDWAMVGGIGLMAGSSELAGAGLPALSPAPGSAVVRTEARFADLQAHGQLVGNDMGVYITYAIAPAAQTGALPQLYNAGVKNKSAFAAGVDYSVIPHRLHVGGAYRMGKTGAASIADPAISQTDNALMLQAIYDLTQNVAFHVTGATRSGTKYSEAPTTAVGAKEYLLMLEAAW